MDDDSLVIRSITLGTPPAASDTGSTGITLEAYVRAGARAQIHVDPHTAGERDLALTHLETNMNSLFITGFLQCLGS